MHRNLDSMGNKHLILFLKYITGYLLLQFIITKLLSSTQSLVSIIRGDLIPIISTSNYYTRINEENFLIFTFKGFAGNWGQSFSSNTDVIDLLSDPLKNSMYLFFIIISISGILSLLILYLFSKLDNSHDKLSYFQGNWLILPSFMIMTIISLFTGLFPYLIFDDFRYQIFIGSLPFYFTIVSLGYAGALKILSEASTFPIFSSSSQDLEAFPKASKSGSEKFTGGDNFSLLNGKDGFLRLFLLAFKSSIFSIFEFLLIYEIVFNLPGVGIVLRRSIFFANIPVLMALVSYLLLFVVSISFMISMILMLLNIDEKEIILNLKHERKYGSQGLLTTILQGLTYFILFLIGLSWFLWLFTGHNYGTTGLLKNPNFVNISFINQPPFSSDYLLGTDYLGRDVFSRIFAGFSTIFVPIIVSIIIRPILVIFFDRYLSVNNYDIGFHIIDFLSILPKFPIILFVGLFTFEVDSLVKSTVVSFWFSIIFVGEIGKKYYRSNLSFDQSSTSSKYILLAQLSIISILIEIFLLSYSIGLGNTYGWGYDLNSAINNYPTKYFGVFISYLTIPLLMIIIPSVYFMSRIRSS